MTLHVLTDSSHYLEPATAAELDLHVLPLGLAIKQREYQERVEITTEQLFEMLKQRDAGWPKTAAVTPGALQLAFDELTRDGDEVVAIFLSRGTSVTVETAQLVAASHPARDRIHLVDSLAISGALALTLRIVAPLVQKGLSGSQVADVARRMGQQMRVMFTVDTLDYLHRGGRMRGSQALLGGLLGIKPVLWLNEGRIELWSKARGKRRALESMLEECVRAMPAGQPILALLFDAVAPAEKEWMAQRLRERLTCHELYEERIGPVVAAHVGPGCLAMAVCPVSATLPESGS